MSTSSSERFLEEASQAQKPTNPIIAVLVTMIGYLVAGVVPLLFGIGTDNMTSFVGQFVMTASFAVWIAIIFAWVVFKEKRSILSLGFRDFARLDLVKGALIGVVLSSIVVGVSVVTGQAELSAPNWGMLGLVILLLIGFSIQASAEEIAYRGYIMQTVASRFAIWVAIAVQAIVFTLGHIGNGLNPILIAAMLAVSYFLAMWVLATGNLWGAMGFHIFWNWSQSTIWGASVSNIKMETSLMSFHAQDGSLISGGTFGLEGSLITIVALVLLGVYFNYKWIQSKKSE